MTIREAILADTPFEVSTERIDKVLIDAGLEGASLYTVADKKAVDLCIAELCLVKAAEANISEGELSINFNPQEILSLREKILKKYDLEEGGLNGDVVW